MIETGSYWWPSLPLQRETQAGDEVVNMHEAKTGRSKSREDQLSLFEPRGPAMFLGTTPFHPCHINQFRPCVL